MSTGVSGSLFPGKTWEGGWMDAAPVSPCAGRGTRPGAVGTGECCSRAVHQGPKGYRHRSHIQPWPPLAPLQLLMRSRHRADWGKLSPAPQRNQSPNSATGPGAPVLLLCPPNPSPKHPEGRVPRTVPRNEHRDPQTRPWHGPWHRDPKPTNLPLPGTPRPAPAQPWHRDPEHRCLG